MLNLSEFWNEKTEKLEVQRKLLHLKELLDDKVNWENPTKYIILEYFPKESDDINTYTPNVYKLVNLKIDYIEDGIVGFDDAEGILEEFMYNNTPLPLQAFTVDSIIYIAFQNQDSKITISQDNGYIQIYY